MPSARVILEPAARSDEPVLRNLLELYIHDLSEIFPQARIHADGRFGYDMLPLYWKEPGRRWPFLIRANGELAGFALAMRGSPATEDPDDLDVAEFFVLRGYRREGVGRIAAPLLWDRIPGSWTVRVSTANRPGVPFWESVVHGYTRGDFAVREMPGRSDPWRVYSFRSPRG